ncbi:dihydrofolate reductase [Candidatus Microgenomates bacterium]|nr:dihydrofolate reductase [Candidatus Microgenomates bacterium]
MKVILYMAITPNGLIAKSDDDTNFTSKEDHLGFRDACLESKAIIVGRRTYDLLNYDPEFYFPQCSYFVVSQTAQEPKENFVFCQPDPQKILALIESKGFNSACVIGGGKTNTTFLQANLVDEIYLDVEPAIFGQGIPLFSPADFEFKLDLLEVKNLSPQTVQLHYRVKKQ